MRDVKCSIFLPFLRSFLKPYQDIAAMQAASVDLQPQKVTRSLFSDYTDETISRANRLAVCCYHHIATGNHNPIAQSNSLITAMQAGLMRRTAPDNLNNESASIYGEIQSPGIPGK